ncbi:MAG: hypothetical protein WCQ57_14115 [Verrucomicrobiota bacterium]
MPHTMTTHALNAQGFNAHADFSVVVKNRARPPKPWRWEIYRAGRNNPVDRSLVFFESMTEANRAGKAALKLMLSEYPA